jgi:hypothetical protein
MMNFFRTLMLGCAFVLTTVSAGSVMAATLNVDSSGSNKVLLGISGISVGGTSYDVSFMNGTCASLFDGCDEAEDFVFQTSADAVAANTALHNAVIDNRDVNVFLNGFEGARINGCDNVACTAITAYAPPATSSGPVLISYATISNVYAFAGTGTYPFTRDTTTVTSNMYAVWSTPTAVPLPAGFPLMLAGLGAFYWVRRRQA